MNVIFHGVDERCFEVIERRLEGSWLFTTCLSESLHESWSLSGSVQHRRPLPAGRSLECLSCKICSHGLRLCNFNTAQEVTKEKVIENSRKGWERRMATLNQRWIRHYVSTVSSLCLRSHHFAVFHPVGRSAGDYIHRQATCIAWQTSMECQHCSVVTMLSHSKQLYPYTIGSSNDASIYIVIYHGIEVNLGPSGTVLFRRCGSKRIASAFDALKTYSG